MIECVEKYIKYLYTVLYMFIYKIYKIRNWHFVQCRSSDITDLYKIEINHVIQINALFF